MTNKIIVSGVGCCLVDLLFKDIDFAGDTFRPYLSVKRGDGGLTPGHLVFNEEFAEFAGSPIETVIRKTAVGVQTYLKPVPGESFPEDSPVLYGWYLV